MGLKYRWMGLSDHIKFGGPEVVLPWKARRRTNQCNHYIRSGALEQRGRAFGIRGAVGITCHAGDPGSREP